MARTIQFEGRQVQVPDDATDDEVASVLSATPAAAPAPTVEAPAPAPAPAAEPSLVSRIMSSIPGAASSAAGTAAYGLRGVRQGVANIAGLPVDTLNAAMGLVGVPVSQRPTGGSKQLDELLGGYGAVPDLPPAEGIVDRGAKRIGEEVGAAAVPVGAALRAGAMGVEAARKLPILARMFVEPAAIAPGTYAGKEAMAAIAAGGGAAGANEITRASGANESGAIHNAADMAGAFTGAGALGAAKLIGKPISNIAQAVMGRDKFNNRVVEEAVTDQIANTASGLPKKAGEPIDTQPLVDTIMGGRRVSDTVPGFKESLADRTADPGLAAVEYGRQSGPNSGMFTQRRSENTAAVDNAMKGSEPQGTPGALRNELSLERDRRLTDAGVQTRNAQDQVDQLTQQLQPAMTAEGRGADIRAALEHASDDARNIVRQAWEPINNSGQHVDMAPLAERFGEIDQGLSTAERGRFRPNEANIPEQLSGDQQPPPVNTGLLGSDGQPIMRQPPPVDTRQPINEVTGLRNALTDAAREARNADRVAEARVIDQHVEALDNYLNQAVAPELRQDYDAARAATRDFNDRFTRPQTAVGQVLDRQQGQYRQPDNAVPAKFVQPDNGRLADYRALMQEAGADPRARGAVEDQIVAEARQRGVLDRPDQLDRFLQERSVALGDFPGLRTRLQEAGTARRGLDTATGAEAATTRELGTPDRPGTGTVGQYLRHGPERAQDAMKGVLASKEPGRAADELLRFVNDEPQAVDGARKAFWDIMQQRSRSAGETTKTVDGVQPWMPRRLQAFLDDPAAAAVAERLWRDNPEHLDNIKQIAAALQGVDVRARAKAPNTSGTAQGVNNVLTPETLQSRFYAYKRGQTSLGFMVTALASVAARRMVRGAQSDAIERLLDNALLNPDVAADLLKNNNPANRAALARTSKAFMGNEASTLMDILDGEDKSKDPVTEAVQRGPLKITVTPKQGAGDPVKDAVLRGQK